MLRPEIDSTFLEACTQGNLELLKTWKRGDVGLDLVHLGLKEACAQKHRNVAAHLMELGAWDLEPALEGACAGGDVVLVKRIIRNGATNWTEGHAIAVVKGHQEIVQLFQDPKWLLEFLPDYVVPQGFRDISSPRTQYLDYGYCFEKACQEGNVEVAKQLRQQHEIKIIDKNLRAAGGSGNLQMVQYLLESNPVLNRSEYLLGAAEKQQLEVVKFYLQDTKARIPSAEAVFVASESGNYEITELLCSKVLDRLPSTMKDGQPRRERFMSQTPACLDPHLNLHLKNMLVTGCEYACRGGNMDIINMYIKGYGVPRSYLDLPACCAGGCREAMKIAFEQNPAPIILTKGLSMAFKTNNLGAIMFLIEIMEKLDQVDWLPIALFAIRTGNHDLFENMLQRMPGIKDIDNILCEALTSGYMRMVHLVLEKRGGRFLPSSDRISDINTLAYAYGKHRFDTSLYLLKDQKYDLPSMSMPYGVDNLGFMMLMMHANSLSGKRDQMLAKRIMQKYYKYVWKRYVKNIASITQRISEHFTRKPFTDAHLDLIMRYLNLVD